MGGDASLHSFAGVVDLAVVDNFETVVDEVVEGGLALDAANEGRASQETENGILEHEELGDLSLIVLLALLQVVLSMAENRLTTVLQNVLLSHDVVAEVGSVHDGLESLVLDLRVAESLVELDKK